ncbi:hypothetical protein HID58_078836, partial [Brassica napus]
FLTASLKQKKLIDMEDHPDEESFEVQEIRRFLSLTFIVHSLIFMGILVVRHSHSLEYLHRDETGVSIPSDSETSAQNLRWIKRKRKRKRKRRYSFFPWKKEEEEEEEEEEILLLPMEGGDKDSRKSILLAAGIVAAGGAAVYLKSRISSPRLRGDDDDGALEKRTGNNKNAKKKGGGGGLKSLQVLTAILLSQMGKMGARDLLALVATVVFRTALSNRLAKVQGFLFRAAFLRRAPLFLRLISENIMLCFMLSTTHATSKYITGALSLRFRKILTKLIHSHYFENMVYYKISHVDGRITHPEQRIASDVPRFSSELSELIQDDLTAVTDGILYAWRLCSYASPKYIFWILAYVLGAGTAIRTFSPSFGKLMSKEQQLEGEYRQLHSRLRTHSESIAFYGGETREESHIQQKFKNLVSHMSDVLHDHWWFGMIQDFLLKYLGATVAVILIIEPFFSGHLRPDDSTLGRAEMLSNIRYHTSVIISLFQALGTLSISSRRLSRLSGYADRIHELMAVSRELSGDDRTSLQRNRSRNYLTEANYVEFSGVKVVTPTGNVLVEDLTLRVEQGSNLLITGPNGSGKSSLFRVLGGLWPLVSGHIVKPGVGSDLNKEIFYVPQRPYMAVGTLRDQLIYPLTSDQETLPLTETGMVELLENVALVAFHDVVLSLDGEGGWSVHYKRDDSTLLTDAGVDSAKISDTDRQNDAMVVQRAFAAARKESATTNSKAQAYLTQLITKSPVVDKSVVLPRFPQPKTSPRALPLRIAAMLHTLIPTLLDKQGGQLLLVACLVVSRTLISDRIASLNGILCYVT